MKWITKVLVLAIHARQLADYGGSGGIRDDNLLESALARPQQLAVYADPAPDIAALGASLAFGIARNHAFVDGNKRTASVACETFVRLNGSLLVATDAEFYIHMLALAEGRLGEDEFAAWLRVNLRPSGTTQINEPAAAYAR